MGGDHLDKDDENSTANDNANTAIEEETIESNNNATPNNVEQPPVGPGDYAGLNWGWHAHRIRLPDFFDYTCRGEPPQPPTTDEQPSYLSLEHR